MSQTITTTKMAHLAPDAEIRADGVEILAAVQNALRSAEELGGHAQEIIRIEIEGHDESLEFYQGRMQALRTASVTVTTRLT